MLAPLVLVFAQAIPAPAGRPLECSGIETRAGNVWERAKAPALRRYCDLLASGASKLASSGGPADEVLALADEADRVAPGHAAPAVLRGRALARLGRYPEAYAALKDVRAKDDRALDDALSLLTWARVASHTGHLDEGREAYRALLPRASTLGSPDRGLAYLEAGMALMAHGPRDLDEAIAALRQARREGPETLSVVALALALDRAGEHDEARATLEERLHGDPRPLLAEARAHHVFDATGSDVEIDALEGLALEGRDAPAARAAWQRYAAAAASGPWAAHAREREAALTGRGGKHR